MEDRVTTRRVLGAAAFALCLGLTVASLLGGFATSFPGRQLQFLAVFVSVGVLIFVPLMALGLRMAGWSEPESEAEFEEIVKRSERMAAGEEEPADWETDDYGDDFEGIEAEESLGWQDFDPRDEGDFDLLVRAAIDDLPVEFSRVLETVPVVVSDKGASRRAYGLYQGDTIARDNYPDRILIFRDTLVRDFGHDPEMLRAQVTRTVRHEIAHHLGWDERGVRDLGL
jgi:predicted Zn-dependent protease with MMP-like domain